MAAAAAAEGAGAARRLWLYHGQTGAGTGARHYTGDRFIGFHDVFSPGDRINSADTISTNEITERPPHSASGR